MRDALKFITWPAVAGLLAAPDQLVRLPTLGDAAINTAPAIRVPMLQAPSPPSRSAMLA